MRTEILAIIAGMALVTFFTRFASLAVFNRTGIPAYYEKWLKYVPISILTALIIPALLLPQGKLDLSLDNHYLLAGLVVGFVAYRFKNAIAAMGLGLAVMLSLCWLAL